MPDEENDVIKASHYPFCAKKYVREKIHIFSESNAL